MKQNIRNLPFLRMALLILLSACAFCVRSQVTVGSGVEPVKGAILDLKSHVADGDNVTSSSGGLLLPRVKLVSTTSLEPFIAVGDQTPKVRDDHKGLIVYNLATTAGFTDAIYRWDGTQWLTLAGAGGTPYTVSSPITLSGNDIGLIPGTANGQVLKWNGTAWVLATDTDTNTTYTGTAPIAVSAANAISLNDGGVTNVKIANTTITQAKLVGSGTVGQVLTTTTANAAPTWQTPKSSNINGQVISAGSSAVISNTATVAPGASIISSGTGIYEFLPGNVATRLNGLRGKLYDSPVTSGEATSITGIGSFIIVIHATTTTTIASGWRIAPY